VHIETPANPTVALTDIAAVTVAVGAEAGLSHPLERGCRGPLVRRRAS